MTFFCLSLLLVPYAAAEGYSGSSFDDIHRRVFADPYEALPRYRIDPARFGPAGHRADNRVLQAGLRTLTQREDLLSFPGGQKLFQANGICFVGEWQIDAASNYSGQFRQGIRTPVIARASVALDGTLRADTRAFGMAVKLFPAPDRQTPVHTLNLFVMHSLGGVKAKHVLGLAMDNEPALGSLPPWSKLATALRLRRDFERADRTLSPAGPDVAFRPVSHLATEGGSTARSPLWVRLRADEAMPRIDADDFREELRVEQYPDRRLVWSIEAAQGERGDKANARWHRLGQLVMDQSITSPACDQQLHFAHPTLTQAPHPEGRPGTGSEDIGGSPQTDKGS
ncbi:MAG: hypothetical protein AAGA91_19305 [Pseudomonadota bacterium]